MTAGECPRHGWKEDQLCERPREGDGEASIVVDCLAHKLRGSVHLAAGFAM